MFWRFQRMWCFWSLIVEMLWRYTFISYIGTNTEVCTNLPWFNGHLTIVVSKPVKHCVHYWCWHWGCRTTHQLLMRPRRAQSDGVVTERERKERCSLRRPMRIRYFVHVEVEMWNLISGYGIIMCWQFHSNLSSIWGLPAKLLCTFKEFRCCCRSYSQIHILMSWSNITGSTSPSFLWWLAAACRQRNYVQTLIREPFSFPTQKV